MSCLFHSSTFYISSPCFIPSYHLSCTHFTEVVYIYRVFKSIHLSITKLINCWFFKHYFANLNTIYVIVLRHGSLNWASYFFPFQSHFKRIANKCVQSIWDNCYVLFPWKTQTSFSLQFQKSSILTSTKRQLKHINRMTYKEIIRFV